MQLTGEVKCHEVPAKKLCVRWKLQLYSTPDTYALTNTSDYPFGEHVWTIYNDPCYNEQEITVTLNMNSCTESEFNCADGQCVDITQRCDGKINCHDKTG